MKNVIFDLDLTLVDTSVLEPFRRNRDWQGAYRNIHKCYLYPGVLEVFNFIRQNNINACIVSTAPRPYIEKIVKYFDIPVEYIIGYHDAKPIKPSQVPMLKALDLMGCSNESVVAFGDRGIDIISSKAAYIKSVACTWGTKEMDILLNSAADVVISLPIQMIEHIR